MRKVLTPAQMREAEERYMRETGVSSAELMQRAAGEVFSVIEALYGTEKTVYFACGRGGNGGDGYGCAARYAQAGGIAVAVETGAPMRQDSRLMRENALEAGVTITDDWRILPRPDLWVDALFGGGLNRAPEGEDAALIGRMNADEAEVLSVDVPSGLNGATGAAYADCVAADVTVTFQRPRTGHYLADGLDFCGDVLTRDIGIPDDFLPEDAAMLVSYADVKPRPRRRNSYKGNYGHLLIVAGSRGMAGAAAICAQAAMRAGAGLTTVACPESILNIIQTLAPCAMALPLPEENGALSERAVPELKAAMAGKTCVACGSGLSRRCAPEVVRAVLESGLPAVLDADALNLISQDAALQALLGPRHIITPHPGEARRLLGRELTDPISDARALRRMGPQAVLKGASSVIAAGNGVYISASGCAGMAKGGSGDALTGMTGAILAQGVPPETAAYVASQLHGLAGEAAQEEFGERGMLATDLVEMITEAVL